MQEILEESIFDQIIGLIIKHRGENNLMVYVVWLQMGWGSL